MGRIQITFKNNPKEKAVEAFLESKLSASSYIKELVWDIINNNFDSKSNKQINESNNNEINNIDDWDF